MIQITLDMLTQDSVSVKKQEYNDSGETVGKPHRKAYINSASGRDEVRAELEQQYQDAIFAIWGDTPTVTEDIPQ